jgi:hypothetical protein
MVGRFYFTSLISMIFIRSLYSDRVQVERKSFTPNADTNGVPFEAMPLRTNIGELDLHSRIACSHLLIRIGNALAIQVMSDLHLEVLFRCPGGDSAPGYDVFDCTSSSPILALLGDIGLAVQDGLFIFLQRQLFKYEKIFFVMGNHEYHLGSPVSQVISI